MPKFWGPHRTTRKDLLIYYTYTYVKYQCSWTAANYLKFGILMVDEHLRFSIDFRTFAFARVYISCRRDNYLQLALVAL